MEVELVEKVRREDHNGRQDSTWESSAQGLVELTSVVTTVPLQTILIEVVKEVFNFRRCL